MIQFCCFYQFSCPAPCVMEEHCLYCLFPPTAHHPAREWGSRERRYREILGKEKEEYGYIPAGEYYKDGYDLFLRMEKYMQGHLLFLHDLRVPATNNEAERLLRNYKRKQKQAVTFRSTDSINHLCECMSMLVWIRQNEETNIFDRVSQIFG